MNAPTLVRAIVAQTVAEFTLTLRRGESVLVTIIIPLALLVFFASARVLPGSARAVTFLLPGTLALAVISTGLVSLGIATAYERYYGVLKQFGATPLPRAGLLAAKLVSVALIELGQVIVLVAVAVLAYGWRPHGSPWLALGALALGTVTFAGLGLLMAGALRAEATLAIANGIFLFFLLLGGLYLPLDHLPDWLATFSRYLPAWALADVLRSLLGIHASIPARSGLVLLAWGIASPLAAALTFKWE